MTCQKAGREVIGRSRGFEERIGSELLLVCLANRLLTKATEELDPDLARDRCLIARGSIQIFCTIRQLFFR